MSKDDLFEGDAVITSPTSPKPSEPVKSNLPRHLQTLVDMLPLNVEVHRSAIEAAYGKSNYARRVRKIVSEYGWDIERRRGSKGANDDYYIRRSDGPIRKAHIRKEVPPKLRMVVYERDGWVCQMCHVDVQDISRPQCDHKVPAERGGPSTDDNLQTLCLQCNLKKRQACRHCDLTSCDACPFAFPEKFEDALVLSLPNATARKLMSMAEAEGIPTVAIITRLIDQA